MPYTKRFGAPLTLEATEDILIMLALLSDFSAVESISGKQALVNKNIESILIAKDFSNRHNCTQNRAMMHEPNTIKRISN